MTLLTLAAEEATTWPEAAVYVASIMGAVLICWAIFHDRKVKAMDTDQEAIELPPINLNKRLRAKYTQPGGPKSIKNTKAGNGKMDRNRGKLSWKAGTGTGK